MGLGSSPERYSAIFDGVLAMIVKQPNGKYAVMSEKGKKLGEGTEEEMKKRLAQIEMFKHMRAAGTLRKK